MEFLYVKYLIALWTYAGAQCSGPRPRVSLAWHPLLGLTQGQAAPEPSGMLQGHILCSLFSKEEDKAVCLKYLFCPTFSWPPCDGSRYSAAVFPQNEQGTPGARAGSCRHFIIDHVLSCMTKTLQCANETFCSVLRALELLGKQGV